MGSKLRKLRKEAGFTGYEYRRNVKRTARARELADRLGAKVAVSAKHPGAPAGSAFLEARTALTGVAISGGVAPGIDVRGELAVQRLRLEQLLGPNDAARAVEALDRYVSTVGETRVGVGEQVIRDLSRGAKPWHLEALRSGWPDGEPNRVAFSLDDVSAAAAIAQLGQGLTRYEHEVAGRRFETEDPGPEQVPAVEPVRVGEPRREPAMRRPGSRLALLQQVLLVSTIFGMGALPSGGEDDR